MAFVLISTIEDAASGIKLEIWAEDDGAGGVNFKIESVGTNQANYDLNGFFVDVGNDGGTITSVGTKSNNMNGSSADGVKLDGFDYAAALGSVGGKDANWTEGTFNIAGLSFADLDGAQLGIRATSVGADGEGSLKLVGDAEIPDEPDDDFFPDLPRDISNVTFYFQDDSDDGVYTVKIDVPEDADDDLDSWYADALAKIIADDPYVTEDTLVYGVGIKGGKNLFDPDQDNADDPYDQDYVWNVPDNAGNEDSYAYFSVTGDQNPDYPNDPLPAGLTAPITDSGIDNTVAFDPSWIA